MTTKNTSSSYDQMCKKQEKILEKYATCFVRHRMDLTHNGHIVVKKYDEKIKARFRIARF